MHSRNAIIYFGFNSFNEHKRGVENVIKFQSEACPEITRIYIHFGKANELYRWNNLICISIKINILRFLFLNLLMLKILRRYNKVIIHSHNYLMSLFLMRKIEIMTVHDAIYYQVRCLRRRYSILFKIIEKAVYRKTGTIHFISEFAKSNSLIRADAVSVIIHNTSFLESAASNDEAVIITNSTAKKYVLAVRSIEERAGIGLLIDVAEKYRGLDSELSFIIAGKGPLLEYYAGEITKRGLKNISLSGYVTDNELIKLYSGCAAVINIALYAEGFGLPVIEGYLFNKPVIASDVCAIPEVIINPAYLFRNDVDDIICKIDYALTTSPLEFRTYYNEKFGNRKIISQFTSLYYSNINQ